MKNNKYIALLALMILFCGCGNDWLDLNPTTSIETEGALTEFRDFEFILNGAYSSMQSGDYYGAQMTYFGDLAGDDMKSYNSTSTGVDFYTFSSNSSNGTSSFWSSYYGIVKNINILLRDIETIPLNPDNKITTPSMGELTEQEYYNILKGEALAIRALLLFDMTRLYGYPYLKDQGKSLAVPIVDKVVPREYKPARNTVAQCYTAILTDLKNSIDIINSKKKQGKINKWAAMTLLSRVYLYQGDNKNALKIAEDAIAGAEKAGYGLWSNEEYPTIWATPFNKELLFEIVNLTTDSPGKSSIGYYSTKYNLIATEKFYKKGIKGSKDVRAKMVSAASSSKPFCLKYPSQGGKSYEDANIPVFRLSELYLNAAEAAVKENEPEKAYKYLNPIYQRTGKSLTEGTTVTLDMVLEQCRIEFWGEGHRFFDLIRNHKKVERADHLSEVQPEAISFDWDYYKVVLPVPRSEMNVNENMIQNPGYGN